MNFVILGIGITLAFNEVSVVLLSLYFSQHELQPVYSMCVSLLMTEAFCEANDRIEWFTNLQCTYITEKCMRVGRYATEHGSIQGST